MKMIDSRLIPEEYIKKYGGKAGGWFYLHDYGRFDLHLVPLTFLHADQLDFAT